MKKILIFLCLLVLTGCKNELVCISTTEEEGYLSEQKIMFEIKDDKVSKMISNYTMTFENEETAKMYLEVFKSIDSNYDVAQNGNKVVLKSEQPYEEERQKKEEVKQDFEKNGYSCK